MSSERSLRLSLSLLTAIHLAIACEMQRKNPPTLGNNWNRGKHATSEHHQQHPCNINNNNNIILARKDDIILTEEDYSNVDCRLSPHFPFAAILHQFNGNWLKDSAARLQTNNTTNTPAKTSRTFHFKLKTLLKLYFTFVISFKKVREVEKLQCHGSK